MVSEGVKRIGDVVRGDDDVSLLELFATAEQREVDYAFVPEGRRFADLRLLAMDMDSTLITIESIDELGDFAGEPVGIAAVDGRGHLEQQVLQVARAAAAVDAMATDAAG